MGIILCPDCHEENFSTASFCKKCSADLNKRPPFSRFLGKLSALKGRPRATLLIDILDVLEDYGGPWGWSLRLNRPPDRTGRR